MKTLWLFDPEIIVTPGRPQYLGDRHRRHRHPVRGPLGFQPVAGLFPDHEIDQFEPPGVVDRFRQQFPVTIIVVARDQLDGILTSIGNSTETFCGVFYLPQLRHRGMNSNRVPHVVPSRLLHFMLLQLASTRTRSALHGIVVTAYLFAQWYGLVPPFLQSGINPEDWEADDIIFVSFVICAGLAIFSLMATPPSPETMTRRHAEKEASKRRDPLTGLPNRRYFIERLAKVLSEEDSTSFSAILKLDLDGLKAINLAYGHAAGDRVIREFVDRLTAVMTADAIVSRITGNKFAVIMPAIASPDDAAALAGRIADAAAAPFLGRIQASLGVSIGISISSGGGTGLQILVQQAEQALYRAKADGRNGTRFFEPDINARLEHRAAIERELRAAVTNGSIIPFYQPLVALEDERIIGFEALARWHSNQFGWVPLDQFIAIAEDIGLIGELGDQLLRQACLDARAWPAEMTLAFNISAVQLRDPNLAKRIFSIVAETGFSLRRLELEITETGLADNMKAAQNTIKVLRQAGGRIALDHFGSGDTTLSQLFSLQLDRIKIDRRFIDRLGKDAESETILRAILALAKEFGLATNAVGIENADQLAALNANGCLEGQGYLFGKAVPAAEIMCQLQHLMPDMKAVA